MKTRNRTLAMAIVALGMVGLSSGASAQTAPKAPAPATGAPSSDKQAIEEVITKFKAALVAKDKKGMAALFYNEKVVWLTSAHPATREALARMQGKPTPIVEEQGAYQFLDDPRIASIAIEERFYHPQILTDGQIATVVFDYDFRAQGAIQNWGQETWQMVKTETGWRILNLLFSANVQMVTPAPQVR